MKLSWENTAVGQEATSSEHDDGSYFSWLVSEDDSGYFVISGSTAELLPESAENMGFRDAEDAKLFCQTVENWSDTCSRFELVMEKIEEAQAVVSGTLVMEQEEHF